MPPPPAAPAVAAKVEPKPAAPKAAPGRKPDSQETPSLSSSDSTSDADHDRIAAMNYLQERQAAGEVVTGLLYVDPESDDLHAHLDTVQAPLNTLASKDLCPGSAALDRFNASLR